jgi:hypothetical protein
VRKESPSRDIHRRRLALIASQELLVLSAARHALNSAQDAVFGEVLGCLRCLSQHGAAGFDDLFFMLCDAMYRCRYTSNHALDAVADIVAHALEAICDPVILSSSSAAASSTLTATSCGGLNMQRCTAVGLSVVAATISTSATIIVCAPRSSSLRTHTLSLLNAVVLQLWASASQPQAAGGITDRACVVTVVTCMELIAAVAPCLVAAAFPTLSPHSSLAQWFAVVFSKRFSHASCCYSFSANPDAHPRNYCHAVLTFPPISTGAQLLQRWQLPLAWTCLL